MTTSASHRTIGEIPVKYVRGMGEKRAAAFRKFGVETVEDLLEFIPRRYLDRSTILPIAKVQLDEEATVVGEVVSKEVITRGKRRLIVRIYDRSGVLEGVWFNQIDVFKRIFSVGQTVAFSGKVGRYRHWQMVHPDFDILSEQREPLHTSQIIPIYPGSEALKKVGLNSYAIRRIIKNALDQYGEAIPETLPEPLRDKHQLLSRKQAYQGIHFPDTPEYVSRAIQRFKYEEIFYLQLLMGVFRHQHKHGHSGLAFAIQNNFLREVVQKLPFELTNAQRRVLREIYQDLMSGQPMNRLVQGDVGSGKTIVAVLTMLMAFTAGYQAAMMAPTEILAQQHYLNLIELLNPFEVRVALLIGSLPARQKAQIQRQIAAGEVDLVIGTHALIQEDVQFVRLGLVVIDEQHRFGVLQRGNLIAKGHHPHVLVMTATPIPRTLALTLYGDLDVSIIDELPPGRQKIVTAWRTESSLPKILAFIKEKVRAGDQAYVVYPLIEESEKIDLKAAKEAFEQFEKAFPEFKVGLLHGRMRMNEKEAVMNAFKRGAIHILVSTTVIEVGVDVPNATIMLIEHAERFGLSQLHQLRGRIGRGKKKSYCILVTPETINEVARQRMRVMEETTDGFRIAEEDLRLRGSGEFLGTRQHGLSDLKYVDLVQDAQLIQIARQDAFQLLSRDPQLRLPEHAAIRQQFFKLFADKFELAKIA